MNIPLCQLMLLDWGLLPQDFDELEVLAGQRVERVRHPDASVPIARIGCS
jgi:hypothetical protein